RKLSQVASDWNALKSSVYAGNNISGQEAFTRHSQLIKDLGLLLKATLSTYGLSNDPEPASHSLVIANLSDLPRLTNSLGKIRGAGAGALSGTEITGVQQSKIEALLTLTATPLSDYAVNMNFAASSDGRFENAAKAATDIETRINAMNELTRREIIYKSVPEYNANRFFDDFSAVIGELYSQNETNINSLETVINERIANIQAERTKTLSVITAVLVISGIIAFLFVRSLQSSTSKLVRSFNRISDGDYDIDFNTKRKDEMGVLESELAELTEQLKASAGIALEAERVKQALDSGSACFMMANQNREIVYVNEASHEMFKTCEAEIRETLPQFYADKMIGSDAKNLHSDAVHFQSVLDGLNGPQELNLELGPRSFKLMLNPIQDAQGNNLGVSIEWHDMTEIFKEERRVSRILQALDAASTNVMIANADGDVIYMNEAVEGMFKVAESDIRTLLPDFRADKVLNRNIDQFHKNPSHQKGILSRIEGKFESQIRIANRIFDAVISPITDKDGERIGYFVEWNDRTVEIEAEKDIAELVKASTQGQFSKRVSEEGKEGFLLTLAQGLNQLMETTDKGLSDVSNILMAISEGDLTKRIDEPYEGTFDDLKNFSNTTNTNLVRVISKIREASDTISNASSEIAQGNADLSTRTEQQAASLQETASSMEELTSTVRLNAENANQANGLAAQASSVATNGGELIKEVVQTMSSINDSAQKIADIIGVIDGIAFQTNILALNAAVEAARAGEQGRGFAVVASEVRTLAQRSANAAKDIKDLISDSVTKVQSGNELVSKSGETMQEIVVSIQRVNDIMSEIAAASAEQASGIDEVSKAVTQMDEMTQQNAALVEEAAAAAESMRHQASDLNQRVGTFKLSSEDVKTLVSDNKPESLVGDYKEKRSIGTTIDAVKSDAKSTSEPSLASIPSLSEEDQWESF
ncbi:MAG: methyl-accepting chemotaxis protein, partial [Pseudomonadota bacterium]